MNQRIIKFRCWDKEKKEWAKMRLDVWGDWQGASMTQIYPKDKPEEFEHTNGSRWVWLQFTGLLDKNGKEIYEGDIISTYQRKDGTWQRPKEVKYYLKKRTSGFNLGTNSNPTIIGNIYENPELLTP